MVTRKTHFTAIASSFLVAHIRFTLEAEDDIVLSPQFPVDTLRGGFGRAFREVTCPFGANRSERCETCDRVRSCLFAYIFETILGSTHPLVISGALRNTPKAPPPFAIRYAPESPTRFGPGETIAFDLILIGKALDYFSYFVHCFSELGRSGLGTTRGRYLIRKIENIGKNGKPTPIYAPAIGKYGQEAAMISLHTLLRANKPPTRCTLRFVTPLQIQHHGKFYRHPNEFRFGLFMVHLVRRIRTLSFLHCGMENTWPEDIEPALIALTDSIVTPAPDLYWMSRWRHKREDFGGMLGKISFEGDLSPFWPFLVAGEYVHAGRHTSFGLGQYELMKE